MKRYIIPTALFIIGLCSLILFQIIGSRIEPDGTLVEPFFLLPVGYAFIALGIVATIIVIFIKQNKK